MAENSYCLIVIGQYVSVSMFDRYTTTKTSCTEENPVRSHRTVFRDFLTIEDDQRLSNFHLTIILNTHNRNSIYGWRSAKCL